MTDEDTRIANALDVAEKSGFINTPHEREVFRETMRIWLRDARRNNQSTGFKTAPKGHRKPPDET